MTDAEKPKVPYAKYAFKNAYNLTLLGGVFSAAALTGNWWLGLAGAGAEAIWMLFAPDSRLLRKAWFDKVWKEEQAQRAQMALDAKFKQLPEADAMRCSFAQARQQPCRAAHDNQFKPEDMRQQVVKTKNAFTLFGTKISEREQAG